MRAGSLTVLGLLVVAALACGGGGGGGSPSAPPPPATVTGQWNGTWSLTGVNPTNHCVAQFYSLAIGTPIDGRVTMNQSGSNVTGTAIVGDVQTCDFSGTLNGQRFSASLTGCQTEALTVTCSSGLNYEITGNLSSSIEGTFDSALRSFDGRLRSENRATRGSERFDFSLTGSLKLTKQ